MAIHNTLYEALKAGGVEHVTDFPYMPYNTVARYAENGLFVTVTRFDNGMYETAISYKTLMADFSYVHDYGQSY